MKSITQGYLIKAPISEVWRVLTGGPNDQTTTVHMTYSGNILDEAKDIADRRDYYFDPIKQLLEK